ncbi:MAG TPA: hypothetical protein PK127_02120, partial [Clostridiales bacterium]|nr:hypothetical protein [Clostridiales bacterium]
SRNNFNGCRAVLHQGCHTILQQLQCEITTGCHAIISTAAVQFYTKAATLFCNRAIRICNKACMQNQRLPAMLSG